MTRGVYESYMAVSRAYAAAGSARDAVAFAREAVAYARTSRAPPLEAAAHVWLAEVELACDNAAGCDTELEAAGEPQGAAAVHAAVVGGMALTAAAPRDAVALLRAAADQWRALPDACAHHVHERAHTHLYIAAKCAEARACAAAGDMKGALAAADAPLCRTAAPARVAHAELLFTQAHATLHGDAVWGLSLIHI